MLKDAEYRLFRATLTALTGGFFGFVECFPFSLLSDEGLPVTEITKQRRYNWDGNRMPFWVFVVFFAASTPVQFGSMHRHLGTDLPALLEYIL